MNKYQAWLAIEGLNDREIAEQLGISISYANLLRHGERTMTDSLKWRFAQTFGFDLARKLFEQQQEPV